MEPAKIDVERFTLVQQLMTIQLNETIRWRDACLQIFQNYLSRLITKPLHPLDYYKEQDFISYPVRAAINQTKN